MIEVEKKFQPTEEQILEMAADAKFRQEVVIHDIYYDHPDYRLFKKDIRLRNRDGNFELKIGHESGIAEEIEEEKQIASYFNVSDLKQFIESNLIEIINYSARCKQYSKENFNITVDEMSFGYKIAEIELLVEGEKEIKEAQEKINNLAKKYGWEEKPIASKRKEYFRKVKPEVYKLLYGDKV